MARSLNIKASSLSHQCTPLPLSMPTTSWIKASSLSYKGLQPIPNKSLWSLASRPAASSTTASSLPNPGLHPFFSRPSASLIMTCSPGCIKAYSILILYRGLQPHVSRPTPHIMARSPRILYPATERLAPTLSTSVNHATSGARNRRI